MSKRWFLVQWAIVATALAPRGAHGADPVVYYTFDDLGTVVPDKSGHGHDGTPHGGIKLTDAGCVNKCFAFNGTDAYVGLPRPVQDNFTLTAWIKATVPGRAGAQAYEGSGIIWSDVAGVANDYVFAALGTKLSFFCGNPDTSVNSNADIVTGQWMHIAGVRDTKARTISVYINGRLDNSVSHTNVAALTANANMAIGGNTLDSRYFTGLIDEVKLYDVALTAAEIQNSMKPPSVALNVSPANGATDVPRDATLNWKAGQYPSVHDVYCGTVAADVNSASRTTPNGVLVSQGQADPTFDPPGSLAYGQTYYWRIDEVNQSADGTVYKGDLWSFTAEPYAYPIPGASIKATASSAQPGTGPENTINGSGLTGDLHGTDGMTMWTTAGGLPAWIQYQFDKAYKLYDLKVWNYNSVLEAFIGFGAKDVQIEYSTDGVTWTALANVPPFARAAGMPNYAAGTTVSFGGVMAQYVKLTINSNWGGMSPVTGLSEVRFSYVPVQARAPQPATGATGQSVTPTLSWRPGREAGSHQVFCGTDPNAVAQGTAAAQTVTEHAFNPGLLNYGTTYYWRVDEVNATTSTYPGEVWSFTTAAYGVVDDFESYTDTAGQEIFSAWIDGYSDGKSGSFVGNNPTAAQLAAGTGHFAETTIVHGGKQSMPIGYDNTGTFTSSEAARTFTPAQNWTASGIKSLALWLRGEGTNTGGQLYLKINSVKVLYNGSAGDLARPAWTPWNIDLSTVNSLSKVNSLTIGIEGAGSKGTIYVDDIRVYPQTPQYLTPVDPGPANLVGLWAFDGDAKDSSGKGNNGTVNGSASWTTGHNNKALQFDGTSTFVDCGKGASLNLTDAVTVSAWIKLDALGGDRKILGNQDGTTGGYKMGVYSSNLVEFEIRTAANAATLNRTAAGGVALQQGTWYHVAGVYAKGQYLRTYIYGSLDRELVTTAVLGSSTGPFRIGREPFGTGGSWWLGAMDDVAVYNRVLAQEELLWLSGQTTPVAKPFN